ncbi:arginine--tRNA ligase [Klebsiella pneumoniae]|nr:arginine--tRNA ligase [Klebsiella pneumoniae]
MTMGERSTAPMLPRIVADLKAKGLAVESEGATVVFLDEYKNQGRRTDQASSSEKDGGYLYTTTVSPVRSIAMKRCTPTACSAIDSRLPAPDYGRGPSCAGELRAGLRCRWSTLMFGMMLRKTASSFKTRAGGTVKLADLLDSAGTRPSPVAKRPDMSADELENLAKVRCCIGAVKYADLSKNRTTDYVFGWDNMLAFRRQHRAVYAVCPAACSPCSAKPASAKTRSTRRCRREIAKLNWPRVCCSLKRPSPWSLAKGRHA